MQKLTIIHFLSLILIAFQACNNKSENTNNIGDFDSTHSINLTEIVEDTLTDLLNEPQELKADSNLSSVLPNKIFDFIADEPQNTDLKLNADNFYQSVVKIYRKEDKMVGINLMKLSSFKDKDITISSSFDALETLFNDNGDKAELEKFVIRKGIQGMFFYSKELKKSVILISAYDKFFINISGDATLTKKDFRSIANQMNYEELKKL